MNTLSLHMGPLLLGLLVKSTLFLLVVAVACRCLRCSSAAMRHFTGTASLVCLLLLPLLSISLPTWKVAWGHAPTAARLTPAPTLPPVINLPPVIAPVVSPPIAPSPAAPSAAVSAPRTAPVPLSALTRWTLIGFAVWWAGILALLGHFTVGLRRVGMIRRSAVPLADEQARCAEASQQMLRLRRRVLFLRAAESRSLAVPVTWGFLHPVILLPAQSEEWSGDCLRAALLHELAHIQRHDWLTQVLGRLACALYWWHPLVWQVARQTRAESERACDDLVLGTGMTPADYAERLVDVVRSLPVGAATPTAAIAMALPSEVEGRVQAVLAKGRNRRPLGRLSAWATAVLLALCVAPLAALTPIRSAQAIAPASLSNSNAPAQSLSGGGSVALLGVTDRSATNSVWWNINGAVTNNRILSYEKQINAPNTTGNSADEQQKAFVFVTKGVASNANYQIEASPSDNSGILTNCSGPGISANSAVLELLASLPVSAHTCTVRVGVATQPWQTLTSEGQSQVYSGSVQSGRGVNIIFSPPATSPSGLTFTVSDDSQGRVPTRIVAIDIHGRAIKPLEKLGGVVAGDFTQRTVKFPHLTLSDIQSLQFQARPYHWLVFPNIPLQPSSVVGATGAPAHAATIQQANSNPWGWIALPVTATTQPLTFQDRKNGKLLCVIHAAKGYDPVTRTLRKVTITEYRNERVGSTVHCDAMQMNESPRTCYLNSDGPVAVTMPDDKYLIQARSIVVKFGQPRMTFSISGKSTITMGKTANPPKGNRNTMLSKKVISAAAVMGLAAPGNIPVLSAPASVSSPQVVSEQSKPVHALRTMADAEQAINELSHHGIVFGYGGHPRTTRQDYAAQLASFVPSLQEGSNDLDPNRRFFQQELGARLSQHPTDAQTLTALLDDFKPELMALHRDPTKAINWLASLPYEVGASPSGKGLSLTIEVVGGLTSSDVDAANRQVPPGADHDALLLKLLIQKGAVHVIGPEQHTTAGLAGQVSIVTSLAAARPAQAFHDTTTYVTRENADGTVSIGFSSEVLELEPNTSPVVLQTVPATAAIKTFQNGQTRNIADIVVPSRVGQEHLYLVFVTVSQDNTAVLASR